MSSEIKITPMKKLPDLERVLLDPPAVIPFPLDCGCRELSRGDGEWVDDHHPQCEYSSFVAYYMKRGGVGWMYLGQNPEVIAQAVREELLSSQGDEDYESIEVVPCLCSRHEENLMPEFEGF